MNDTALVGSLDEHLPQGWMSTRLSAVCEEVDKVEPERRHKTDFIYIDIGSIDNDAKIIASPKRILALEAPSRARQLVRSGDVLFSTVRTYLRNIAPVSEQLDGQIASTGFCVLRGCRGIIGRYLYWYCLADEFVNRLTPLQRGTSYPAVRDEDVKRQIIEIPPAREQERIVAKIDELFSELDAGVASLKRAKALLKKYRQAVLKAAVTGELSRNWRERHQGEIRESGAELLQRILKARRAAWEAAELKKLRVKGKPPKDDRWKQKYKKPQPPDTSDLPALPDGWVWASIDQLAAPERNSITDGPFGSNLKTAHYTDAGPRVVRLENIGEAKFIDIETHIDLAHFSKLSKHQIFPNDIVIASLGQPLPRACLVPSDLGPAIVKADCIRFKPNQDMADTRYLVYALNSEAVQDAVKGQIHGVGRPRLNLTDVRALAVPLPPVGEQTVIADAIEDQLDLEEREEHEMQRLLSQASALKQSILKAAFAGKLVPQDPSDEPASVLLERIRTERAARPRSARGRPRKGASGAGQLELLRRTAAIR